MNTLENLAISLSVFGGIWALWVNLKEYSKANAWLSAHGVDTSYYEGKVKDMSRVSGFETMHYYLGYPGRKFAYKFGSRINS